MPTDKPTCNEYEIVFAFIHDGEHRLPFFSQIALKAAYDMITNMDYACSLLWIGRRRVGTVEDAAEEDVGADDETANG